LEGQKAIFDENAPPERKRREGEKRGSSLLKVQGVTVNIIFSDGSADREKGHVERGEKARTPFCLSGREKKGRCSGIWEGEIRGVGVPTFFRLRSKKKKEGEGRPYTLGVEEEEEKSRRHPRGKGSWKNYVRHAGAAEGLERDGKEKRKGRGKEESTVTPSEEERVTT